MKALGFFYSWSGRPQLDPYFGSFARAFAELGIELEIVFANELLEPGRGMASLHPLADEARLLAAIRKRRPDFIFSVNNAGTTPAVTAEAGVPVIKWLVDDIPHLFFHKGEAAEAFGNGETIVCYSSTLAAEVERAFPQSRGRVSFISHGTNLRPSDFTGTRGELPVSFVGSCLDWRPLVRVLEVGKKHGAAGEMLAWLATTRSDYASVGAKWAPSPALRAALAEDGMGELHFRRLLSDVATTQDRVEGLRRVADLGLHLYGNALWLETLSGTSQLAEHYEFTRPVDSHRRLMEVYGASRISVNIPNVQNCAGLAARVFDVMASPSLLVTQYHPDSDLFRLFGEDCPVPMYRDLDDLRRICSHFLAHEEERLDLVRRCNLLIGETFALSGRLREMLALAGLSAEGLPAHGEPARVLPTRLFFAVPRSLPALWRAARFGAKASTLRVRAVAAKAARKALA
jgi:hypothetical protein